MAAGSAAYGAAYRPPAAATPAVPATTYGLLAATVLPAAAECIVHWTGGPHLLSLGLARDSVCIVRNSIDSQLGFHPQ